MKEVTKQSVKINIVDAVVSYFNPNAGLKRLKSRMMIGAWAGSSSYNGASRSRAAIGSYNPIDGDANDDTIADLPVLRSRTRDLVRNAAIAGGALNTMVTYVVGTGLTMRCAIDGARLGLQSADAGAWQDDVNARFELWAESQDCDAGRGMNFYSIQALAFRSMMESGDVFALPVGVDRGTGAGQELALQLIEADRVCNKNLTADTAKLVGGIEIDTNGAPLRYHICNQHPHSYGYNKLQKTWTIRQAFTASGRRNVIHLFERRRPGQLRGVPIFAPVIEPLKQIQRYTESELQAAVVRGSFAVFLKMDPNAFSEMFDDNGKKSYIDNATRWDGSYPASSLDGPGRVVNLLPGEEPIESNPGRPSAEFDPFVQAILRQIGCELGLPFEVLIKHFTSSYSAARAALLDAWKTFRVRREFLSNYFCQPIYEEWLTREVAAGRINAPGFFEDALIRKHWCAANWVGDAEGSINPKDDIAAATSRIDAGISTLADESLRYDGKDWWQKHKQRLREKAMRVGGGLESAITQPQPANPGNNAGA